MKQKVILEAITVGIAFTLFFFIVHIIDMSIDSKRAMSHQGIFTQAFVAGFIGHIAFELAGVNKWYAKQYLK
jgi:Na+/H+ antiporter NhaA